MKRTLIALMAIFAFSSENSHAQSLRDLFKKSSNTESATTSENSQKAQNTLSNLSGIGDFVAGLLGNKTVSETSLLGTWSYKQPAVVFESENMLTNVGGIAAGKAAEKKMQTYLDKIGFNAGKLKITFSEDGTGTVTYASKNIPFQWSVAGSDLTLKLGNSALSKYATSNKLGKYTTFKMNCKTGVGSLQIAFKADKLAQFIGKVASAAGKASNSSAINSVADLANKVDGMYLGLTLEK